MARAATVYPQTITQAIRVGEDSISLAFTDFANQLLLIMSSHGKMGRLYKFTKYPPGDEGNTSDEAVMGDMLLGDDDEEVTVVANYIAKKVLSALSRREIVIGISLKDLSKPSVDELTKKVLDVIRPE